ncbi:MAG: HAD family phosphatase [Bacteroidales bacterium]|nr:HAD family phosphatase [Bacteroidales bacterium]
MITNLMFDLGGVIMDIKKEHCVEAFKLLGLHEPERYFGEYGQKGPFRLLEEGMISPKDFHKVMRELIPRPVTDMEIDNAFMQFLIGIPVHRLHELQQLRQQYNVYLLSNTNTIMWNEFILQDFEKDGLCIKEYFDGIATSFEAKVMKPDPKIFEYVIEKFKIKPEETFFLDDSEVNVAAAEKLGFRGAHVPDGKEFFTVLKENKLVE